jgi:hypothetical protein
MMGRALLITMAGMFIVSLMISNHVSRTLRTQNENAINYNDDLTARNLAHSGIQVGLRQLVYTPASRSTILRTMACGVDSITFKDTFYLGRSAIKITAVARLVDSSDLHALRMRATTFRSTVFVPKASIPGTSIHAAVTTHNPTSLHGSMTIDGRDHDTTGATVLDGLGTFGIWTTSTLLRQGNDKIGGTNIYRTDFTPAGPGDTCVVREGQSGSGYPGSPDSVLGGAANGYPEGKLKALAMSGVNGSRYVTDPSSLTTPFRGVTYVELPSGGRWNSASFSGSGVLVIHNSAKNAIANDVHGSFTGLVIVDNIAHLSTGTTIVGAVIGLTPAISATNDFGDGNARILYSSAAVANAIAAVKMDSVATYSNKILAWRE